MTTSQANIAADIYADYADTLAEGDPDAAAGYFVTASALYRSTGRDDEAFEVLEAASALRPGDAETAGALTRVRNELADKYHRQASAAYRRQQLDEAIAIWDHVLEIDPDHNNAQVLRAQAMELKDRLSKLNNGAQQ
ncbi:MAG: hypothetical protein D6773_06470 [Alphaproteobacteria bacterium]|nr:MAG: hypothetical protein D6773_06470 [Alphaproteobacteria bacterium]